jgi:hypothetical protein
VRLLNTLVRASATGPLSDDAARAFALFAGHVRDDVLGQLNQRGYKCAFGCEIQSLPFLIGSTRRRQSSLNPCFFSLIRATEPLLSESILQPSEAGKGKPNSAVRHCTQQQLTCLAFPQVFCCGLRGFPVLSSLWTAS